MDYEFKKNTLDGSYRCVFSMEHAIIGRWLQEEINNDAVKIAEVEAGIASAHTNTTEELIIEGAEISLSFLAGEVTVMENVMLHLDPENDTEYELYDCESVSACGLQDFEEMISKWKAFLANRY